MSSVISAQSTTAYQRAWSHFHTFTATHQLPDSLPISVPTLSLFIAYLVSQSFASATISSYVSAIGFIHRLNGLTDPNNTFIIRKLLQSCHKANPSTDHRLPITKALLRQLINALTSTTGSYFERALLKAMCWLRWRGVRLHRLFAFAEIRARAPARPASTK